MVAAEVGKLADESKEEIVKIRPYAEELKRIFQDMMRDVSLVVSKFGSTADTVTQVQESAMGIVSATEEVKNEMEDLVGRN